MKERHQLEQRGVGDNAGRREKTTQASGTVKQSDILWIPPWLYVFECRMPTPLPLTCGMVIDGAVISRLNICNEIVLLLLDLAMGSLSLSQL